MSTPVLSICVPSRNRQVYFQETIRALTTSLRPDVEFVFVDNSDDASAMDDFMAERLADPRRRQPGSRQSVVRSRSPGSAPRSSAVRIRWPGRARPRR